MHSEKLFIPSKIKVGFQNRQGTYTGKLSYVIYFDEKGKLRKETSWLGWIDKKIDPIELENKPFSGFVLNKGVGGARESYGWNTRNEYIRVFDPRNGGFEFEISVANLLFILRECDCSKGKGLEGEFVYAWDRKDLVLLPVSSSDYTASTKFTDLKNTTVKAKELIPGATYIDKNCNNLIYIERLNYTHCSNYVGDTTQENRYVFFNGKGFVTHKDMKSISRVVDSNPVSNYAELLEKYLKSKESSKISDIKFVNDNSKRVVYHETKEGENKCFYFVDLYYIENYHNNFYNGNYYRNNYSIDKIVFDAKTNKITKSTLKSSDFNFPVGSSSKGYLKLIFENGTSHNCTY